MADRVNPKSVPCCPFHVRMNVAKFLAAMSQSEMVAMLRSKARKVSIQTSHYRGVSLLKQTQKWHAQINMVGRQVGTLRIKVVF